jgi:uncharacterized membrane protein YozB (DUF420 family)
VATAGDADAVGMSKAQRIGGFVLAVILINVLVRVVPLPDVTLPSISLPEFPDWLRTVLKVKNVIVIGFVVTVIVTAVIQDHRRRAR